MHGARDFRHSAGVLALLVLWLPSVWGQLAPQEDSTTQSSLGASTLHISLRLQDETVFTGPASVRVLPSEGYELSGAAESEGDFVFSDVPAGTYTAEISAPGFLTVRQQVQVKGGQRSMTRFVIMRPRPVPAQPLTTDTPSEGSPAVPAKTSWIPPGVDEVVPAVDPNVECPLPHILNRVGLRMTQFVGNLEKFTASERVEHFPVDAIGNQQSRELRDFEYVVGVQRDVRGGFMLEEYRNGTADPSQFPAHIATQGLPGMALLFHPGLATDFKFTCEGLGVLGQRHVWQVHFMQRPDRPKRILGYRIADKYSSLALKGRAWIDPGNFQVVRLEGELVQPLQEVGLTAEHIVIDYQEVPFRKLGLRLWLPQAADLYVERQGRRYYRRHTYRDFKLFVVDTSENIQLTQESYGFTNASDHEVAGVLTVTPVMGGTLGPVSLSFSIPAGASVVKLVGPGKDVGIPVDSVASATFAHNGPQDSIKVDAHLSKESTLDIISGMDVSLKP